MLKIKDKEKLIIKTIIVFLIFWNSSYLQYIPVYLFKIDISHLSNTMRVILSTFSNILVFIIFFFIYRKDLKKDFKDFRKNHYEYMDIGLKWWGIGLFIMFASNFILTFLLKGGGANNEQAVQSMIKTLPWLMLVDAGFIAPFNEEIVFRKSLKDIFKDKWVFVTIAFLLFGGAHVINSAKTLIDYLYLIPYGVLGGAFAMAYYETDNIFTSISLHMIHNTILIILSITILFIG
jgi:membrane protease YdiL (CAAX protease family)